MDADLWVEGEGLGHHQMQPCTLPWGCLVIEGTPVGQGGREVRTAGPESRLWFVSATLMRVIHQLALGAAGESEWLMGVPGVR